MRHQSVEQPNLEFPKGDHEATPDELLLEKIKEGMRHEVAYMYLPPNDPVFDYIGNIRLEQVKKKMPSVRYHDHFRD